MPGKKKQSATNRSRVRDAGGDLVRLSAGLDPEPIRHRKRVFRDALIAAASQSLDDTAVAGVAVVVMADGRIRTTAINVEPEQVGPVVRAMRSAAVRLLKEARAAKARKGAAAPVFAFTPKR